MRSPLSSAHQGGFGVSGGAALQGRPRRVRPAGGNAPYFPAAGATVDLDFAGRRGWVYGAGNQPLESLLTFGSSNSGSGGTRFNSQGLMEASGNGARFDYDPATGACLGLLVEEGRTNVVQNSKQGFSTLSYNPAGAVATPNFATAPDGTLTATRIVTPSANTVINFGSSTAYGITTGLRYAYSCWMQIVSMPVTGFSIYAGDGTSQGGQIYTVSVSNNRITAVNNGGGFVNGPLGWQRLLLPFAATQTLSNGNFTLSVDLGAEFNMWGRQQEQAQVASTDIWTPPGANAGRVFDDVRLAVGPWLNPDEGTIVADFYAPLQIVGGHFPGPFDLRDDAGTNRVGMYINGGTLIPSVKVFVNATNAWEFGVGAGYAAAARVQYALAWANNDYMAVTSHVNQVLTNTALVVPQGITFLRMGRYDNALGNRIRRLRYFPKRAPFEVLRTLMTPA